MSVSFHFRRHALETLLGGTSPLDLTQISVDSVEEAQNLIHNYGYDWTNDEDRRQLYSFYQKALVFLKSEMMEEGDKIPEPIGDYNEFKDLRQLLLFASSKNNAPLELRRWSCALLKAMHVIVHFSHDMYSIFPDEIKKQILAPIESCLISDPVAGATFLRKTSEQETIKLYKFEQKPVKDFRSSVVKLLAKRKLIALNLYDNLGVRFVTWNVFDSFRVARFLMKNSLVSSLQGINDQAVNSIYPVNLFLEVMDNLRTKLDDIDSSEVDALLEKKLQENPERAEYVTKDNQYSGEGYKFIKFVCRKLVRVNVNGADHRFFYPFEVQIMTKDAYLESIQGDQAHHVYKQRQKTAARARLFGITE
jgi:uncharacterized protein (TIGR04562 family)